jgi:hypothetical protein
VTEEEIRKSMSNVLENFYRVAKRDGDLDLPAIIVSLYAALMEIAAQLAEMNERARGDHGGPHFTKPVKE